MEDLAQTCPFPDCGRLFVVPASRHGRRIFCPGCGRALVAMDSATARRHEAERLRRRIAEATAGHARVAGAMTGASPDEIASARARHDLDFIGLLENVRSLWNVGSIFRTADGAGIGRLILAGITGRPPRPEITKTALGAEEAVSWEHIADPEEAVARVRALGYRVLALENHPHAVPLASAASKGRICLVVGHEVAGISPALLTAADQVLALPMRGLKGSLNVAVAFGIAAYALATARGESLPRTPHAPSSPPSQTS